MPEENLQKPVAKSLFAQNLIKNLFFMVLAVLAAVGVFFLEGVLVEKDDMTQAHFSGIDYSTSTLVPNDGFFRFYNESEGEISPDMEVVMENENHEYIFKLNSGNLWGSFSASDADVNILLDENVVLIPDRAAFNLEFDGKRATLAVFDGDIYVGFLEQGMELTEVVDEYSDVFMNIMSVPRDNQVVIALSKVDERIKLLLYSKLVKEFKFTGIPSSTKNSDWVKENQKKDRRYIENLKKDISNEIRYEGIVESEGYLSDFVFWSEENLTFVPKKKQQILLDHLFAFLDSAIYYANRADDNKAEEYLREFDDYLLTLPSYILNSGEYFAAYDQYIDKLSVFSPDESQYKVLEHLLSKKIFDNRDVYNVIDEFWFDVYESLSADRITAQAALDKYYGYLDHTLSDSSDPQRFERYLTYKNQLFDNLFLRYPYFYKDDYFAVKSVLENKLLDLYPNGRLKDELKQFFISKKIEYLKRLTRFFFGDEIPEVSQARNVLERLIEEVNDLMPADTSQVAVLELFEKELDDIGDFWGYLKSPEYNSSKAYGATHKERYEVYLEEKDQIWSFVNIQQEVLGEPVEQLTVADVERDIREILERNNELSNLSIGEIEDVEQRYVEISGVLGGYAFEATYDRDYASLKDVEAYGDTITTVPVKLDGLLSLLNERFVGEDVVEEQTEEDKLESHSERVARVFIMNLVKDEGFEISEENVELVDEANQVYRISDVYLRDFAGLLIILLLMKTLKIFILFWKESLL